MRRERNRSMVCVTEKRTVDHKRILVLCITAVFLYLEHALCSEIF